MRTFEDMIKSECEKGVGVFYVKDRFVYWEPIAEMLPEQGWKIHISCFYDNAVNIAKSVIKFCVKQQVSFKIIREGKQLFSILNKNVNRATSGKFITLYPPNQEVFQNLIRKLYTFLNKYHGPYILSDRRYLDCEVLYYRYGCILRNDDFLVSPDGNKILDNREPYYTLPNFVADPFPENDFLTETSKLLSDYTEISALQFSNGGGIYTGISGSKSKVLIKEARPYVGVSRSNTVIACRRREKALVQTKALHGLVPHYIKDFIDWENYYLVEEFVEGETLKDLDRKSNLVEVRTDDFDEIFLRYGRLYAMIKDLLHTVQRIHECEVVINDLSENNFIFHNGAFVCIDLEDSYKVGDDWPGIVVAQTGDTLDNRGAGFAPIEMDNHKLGYLIMGLFSATNKLLAQDVTGVTSLNVFKEFCRQYQLPHQVFTLVRTLIHGFSGDLEQLFLTLPSKIGELDFSSQTPETLKLPPGNHLPLVVKNPGIALILSLQKDPPLIENPVLSELEALIGKGNRTEIHNIIKEKFLLTADFSVNQLVQNMMAYTFLYFYTADSAYFRNLESLKQEIFTNHIFGEQIRGRSEKLIRATERYVSPYMAYSAGVIKCELILRSKAKSLLSNQELTDLFRGINRNFPRRMNYDSGLAGLTDVFIDQYLMQPSQEVADYLISKLKILAVYQESMKTVIGTDPSFDFGSGGIDYVLNRALNLRIL